MISTIHLESKINQRRFSNAQSLNNATYQLFTNFDGEGSYETSAGSTTLFSRRLSGLVVLLAVVLIFQSGCTSKAKQAQKEVEKEIIDLFGKFRVATDDNDYETLFIVSSPDTAKKMIFETIHTLGSTIKTKDSEALLAKYIDPERVKQIGQRLNNPSEDEVTQMYMLSMSQPKEFFVEANELIQKLDPSRQKPSFGELKDIKISGNIASAKTSFTVTTLDGKKLSKDDAANEVSVYFIRIQGIWFYATEREWSGVSG